MNASQLIELLQTLPADSPVDLVLTPTSITLDYEPPPVAEVAAGSTSDSNDTQGHPRRSCSAVLADATAVLTEAARLRLAGAAGPEAVGDRIDFAEFVTHAVAAAAANVGGIELLLAGRAGSWEADHVRNMLHSTVGCDEAHLMAYRTEPLVVTVAIEDIFDDLGYSDLYDHAYDELFCREQAIDWPDDDIDAPDQQAELALIEELFDRVDQLLRADEAAYIDAFREQALAAAAELYPDLAVPVEVVTQRQWTPTGADGEWWTPADVLRSTAHARTPLPSSGIAPADYTLDEIGDLAATERAAGRDPLTRLGGV